MEENSKLIYIFAFCGVKLNRNVVDMKVAQSGSSLRKSQTYCAGSKSQQLKD